MTLYAGKDLKIAKRYLQGRWVVDHSGTLRDCVLADRRRAGRGVKAKEYGSPATTRGVGKEQIPQEKQSELRVNDNGVGGQRNTFEWPQQNKAELKKSP